MRKPLFQKSLVFGNDAIERRFRQVGCAVGVCGGWEKVGDVDKNAALLLSGVVAGRSEERERERERENACARVCV